MRALTLLFFSIATFLIGEIAHVMVEAARPYSTAYQTIDAMELMGGLLFFFAALGAVIADTVKRIRRRDARELRRYLAAQRRATMNQIPPSYRPPTYPEAPVPAEVVAPTSRATASWVCERCKSVNHAATARCYSCSTWRASDTLATATT